VRAERNVVPRNFSRDGFRLFVPACLLSWILSILEAGLDVSIIAATIVLVPGSRVLSGDQDAV
jgi:hypothetical protein